MYEICGWKRGERGLRKRKPKLPHHHGQHRVYILSADRSFNEVRIIAENNAIDASPLGVAWPEWCYCLSRRYSQVTPKLGPPCSQPAHCLAGSMAERRRFFWPLVLLFHFAVAVIAASVGFDSRKRSRLQCRKGQACVSRITPVLIHLDDHKRLPFSLITCSFCLVSRTHEVKKRRPKNIFHSKKTSVFIVPRKCQHSRDCKLCPFHAPIQ